MAKEVFVLIPSGKDFDDAYNLIICETCAEFGYNVNRALDFSNQQNILKEIVQSISNSDLIIADLTDNNANVFYELGIAHALDKKVILISQDIEMIPFDLQAYRAIQYGLHIRESDNAIKDFRDLFQEISLGKTSFGNPVSDFIPTNTDSTSRIHIVTEENNFPGQEDESDMGILDYATEMEEEFGVVFKVTEDLSKHLNKMTEDITDSNDRLNSPANQAANRRRDIARSAAGSMDEFSGFLSGANKQYSESIQKIDRSVDEIINHGIQNNEDVNDVAQFLSLINDTVDSIELAKTKIAGFKVTLDAMPSIERNLNKAKRNLSELVRVYLNLLGKHSSVLIRLGRAFEDFVNRVE